MSVKYSENERKHARQILRIIGDKKGYKSICKRLEKKGFDAIGGGCYKETFFSDTFPTLVVKVYMHRYGFKQDSTPNRLSVFTRRFFLTPVAHNKRFMIQKKYDRYDNGGRAADRIKKELKDRMPRDAWHNCCWYKRKPYFFDYCT